MSDPSNLRDLMFGSTSTASPAQNVTYTMVANTKKLQGVMNVVEQIRDGMFGSTPRPTGSPEKALPSQIQNSYFAALQQELNQQQELLVIIERVLGDIHDFMGFGQAGASASLR